MKRKCLRCGAPATTKTLCPRCEGKWFIPNDPICPICMGPVFTLKQTGVTWCQRCEKEVD